MRRLPPRQDERRDLLDVALCPWERRSLDEKRWNRLETWRDKTEKDQGDKCKEDVLSRHGRKLMKMSKLVTNHIEAGAERARLDVAGQRPSQPGFRERRDDL